MPGEAGCQSSTSVRSHSVLNQYDVSSYYFSSPNSQHVCQPRGRPQRGPGLRDPGRSDGGPGAMFPWRLVPEAAVAAAAAPAAGGRADPPSRAPSSASSSSSRRAAALPRGGGRGGEGGGAGTRGRADQPRSLPPPSRAMAAAAALRHLLPAAAAAVRAPKTLSLVRVRVRGTSGVGAGGWTVGNGPTGTRTPRTVALEDKHSLARRAPSARARPRKTPLCPAAAAPESQREDNREPAQEGAGWASCACAKTAAACQATKGRAREGRARRCALQAADARHPSPHTPPHAGFWRKPALRGTARLLRAGT